MRNFQILIVSAVKICKQCVTKVLRLLGDFSLTDCPMRPHKGGEEKGREEGKERREWKMRAGMEGKGERGGRGEGT